MKIAKKELDAAFSDISRRPEPDTRGAISRAVGSLECVVREISGDHSYTLGEIMKKQPFNFPKPLDELLYNAIKKIWGYASENARHVREDREPPYEEAELIISLCASIIHYLSSKFVDKNKEYNSEKESDIEMEDPPF